MIEHQRGGSSPGPYITRTARPRRAAALALSGPAGRPRGRGAEAVLRPAAAPRPDAAGGRRPARAPRGAPSRPPQGARAPRRKATAPALASDEARRTPRSEPSRRVLGPPRRVVPAPLFRPGFRRASERTGAGGGSAKEAATCVRRGRHRPAPARGRGPRPRPGERRVPVEPQPPRLGRRAAVALRSPLYSARDPLDGLDVEGVAAQIEAPAGRLAVRVARAEQLRDRVGAPRVGPPREVHVVAAAAGSASRLRRTRSMSCALMGARGGTTTWEARDLNRMCPRGRPRRSRPPTARPLGRRGRRTVVVRSCAERVSASNSGLGTFRTAGPAPAAPSAAARRSCSTSRRAAASSARTLSSFDALASTRRSMSCRCRLASSCT